MSEAAVTVIRHHPSDATLVSYAAGSLWRAAAIVVRAHLDHCTQCAATVRLAEGLGGALLSGLPATSAMPMALERTMKRLDETASHMDPEAAFGTVTNVSASPSPHLSAASPGLRNAEMRWLGHGIRHAVLLRRPDEGTLHLLCVQPGTSLPRHSHHGTEFTLVVEGAFVDEAGRFGPNDLAEVDDAVSHQPRVEGPEQCMCLIATQGRLRFGTLLSRLFGALARV